MVKRLTVWLNTVLTLILISALSKFSLPANDILNHQPLTFYRSTYQIIAGIKVWNMES